MFFCVIFLIEAFFGYIYPIYFTLSLVQKEKKKEYETDELKRWMTYWVVLSIFHLIFPMLNCLKYLSSTIVSIIKLALVLYISLPQTKGSLKLYEKYINNTEIQLYYKEKIRKLISCSENSSKEKEN